MSRLDELIAELCPDGVHIQKLKDITLKISDGMHNLPKGSAEQGRYPILSAQNINNGIISLDTNRWVDKDIFDRENNRTDVQKGDVLLTIVGAIGRTAVVSTDLKALFQRSICVIKPNTKVVLSQYLKHALGSSKIQAYMQVNAHGAAQKGLYLKQVGEIKLPIPPLEVQREIVHILDSFTLLTAELTAELTARKKQYEFYRNTLLTFDNTIKIVPLADIADIGTGSSNTNEGLEEGKYPFYVRSQEPLRKNEYEYDETAIITAGDGVGVGKVFHYIEGKYALHQRAYRIHINTPDVLPRYYFHYMRTAFLPYIQKTMFQGSVASIRRPMLNQFPVPVPTLEVQKRLVNVLDNFESICTDLNIGLPAEIEARQKQYEYYRDLLLTFAEKGSTLLTDRQTDRETDKYNALIRLCQYVVYVRLGDIAKITDYVANGSFASLRENVTYKNEPDYAALIRTTDYSTNFNPDKMVYINEHAYEFLAKSKLFGGEIIINNIGAGVGTTFRCPFLDTKMSLAPNAVMVKTSNDPFYYYWFKSKWGQDAIQKIIGKSAMPKFNKTGLREIIVPMPTREVQDRIVAVLEKFEALCNDISSGLPAEIEARQKQYEYYRDKLLTFTPAEN